jgi:hypothetical protein
MSRQHHITYANLLPVTNRCDASNWRYLVVGDCVLRIVAIVATGQQCFRAHTARNNAGTSGPRNSSYSAYMIGVSV